MQEDPEVAEGAERKHEGDEPKEGQNEANVESRGTTETRPARRPDVDIIRVSLTWGILLFHTTVAFAPHLMWYVKSSSDWSWNAYVSICLVTFMDVWQMPMFFFLSGVSAYFALFRRSESEFRRERAHRLLVPWLLLCLCNGLYSVSFLAKLSPNCEAAYYGRNSTNPYWTHCETYWQTKENKTYPQVTSLVTPLLPAPSPTFPSTC